MNLSKIKNMHSVNISKEKAYNTVIKPIVTEKSTLLLESNFKQNKKREIK